MSWNSDRFPPMRAEAHYGDRVVECYVDRPPHLTALFAQTVAKDPGGEAIVSGDHRLTWAELDADIARIASGMAGRGVSRGDRVAMIMGSTADFIVALFAIFRLGAVAVPLSIRASVPEIGHILTDSGAALVLHDVALSGLVPDTARAIATPIDGLGDGPLPQITPDEEDVALILYTSGTTGKPKGAMLTHLGLIHAGMFYVAAMGLGPSDRVVSCVPLNHVTGIAALISAPIRAGSTLILMEAFKASAFLDLAERERMTYTLMVPAMYNLCLLQPDFATRKLGAWRLAAYGGAPMPESTIRRLAEAIPGLGFANCYGSTETVVAQLITPPEFAYEKRESVGCALPGTEVRVMDDAGREQPPDVAGELWLKGPNVVRGYWNNAEATRANFIAGFWRSGDIGMADADGFVRVLDRAKDMINRGGLKIYSAELENVLTDHPAVVEAAALARPCPVLGERVHAVVVLKSEAGAEDLREWCRARLSDYKVPETLELTQAPLPRNANGKVDKKTLREALHSLSSTDAQ